MPEPSIWIVDDEAAIRFVLATAPRDAGWHVEALAAATSALAAL